MRKIIDYGKLLDTLDLSPFETLNALHLRSNLQKEISHLTNKEKLKLYQYDLYLLDHIEEMKQHLENVYNFSASDEPIEHWWWHLDKIISGEIVIKGSLFVDTDVAL